MKEPIVLHFALAPDECCSLCNPVRLADYERPCVCVHHQDCPRGAFFICLPCIVLLGRGARGEPATLALPLEVSRFMRELLRQSGIDPDETIH